MASKVSASFFDADRVIFAGYSSRHASYCAAIRSAFEARGATVYPVNPKAGGFDTPVYASVAETPQPAELAVVITNKARNIALLDELAAKGVKRVLFGSKVSADEAILAHCAALGMDGAVLCPLQALGGGLHRFHGWLSGVPYLGAKRASA